MYNNSLSSSIANKATSMCCKTSAQDPDGQGHIEGEGQRLALSPIKDFVWFPSQINENKMCPHSKKKQAQQIHEQK